MGKNAGYCLVLECGWELWAPAMALIGGVRERFGEVEACVMAPAPWDRVGGVRAGRLRRA